MTTTGSGKVSVAYQQFYLLPENATFDWDGTSSNGLIEPFREDGAVILTGVGLGLVRYTWETHATRPAETLDGWDDVAEVVVRARKGELHVTGWAYESFDPVNLAEAGPGDYVVRCYARGRAEEWDDTKDLADEVIHIDVWPHKT